MKNYMHGQTMRGQCDFFIIVVFFIYNSFFFLFSLFLFLGFGALGLRWIWGCDGFGVAMDLVIRKRFSKAAFGLRHNINLYQRGFFAYYL